MGITAVVSFDSRPDRVEQVVTMMEDLQPLALSMGCTSITLYRDQDDPERIMEVEYWPSAQAQLDYVAKLEQSGIFDDVDDLLKVPVNVHILNAVMISTA
ncbi:MAG: antibiotic biosynthesis monooxygenase [Immundisolibacteraceae bacterium]|nr:antibiotic biosynthesis monooxygenase [Immundisolibacteraceae bacterium]